MNHFSAMHLTQIISAIGGLGTAAFGLVEAAKSAFGFINRMGLAHISETVTGLTPDQTGAGLQPTPPNALGVPGGAWERLPSWCPTGSLRCGWPT